MRVCAMIQLSFSLARFAFMHFFVHICFIQFFISFCIRMRQHVKCPDCVLIMSAIWLILHCACCRCSFFLFFGVTFSQQACLCLCRCLLTYLLHAVCLAATQQKRLLQAADRTSSKQAINEMGKKLQTQIMLLFGLWNQCKAALQSDKMFKEIK